MTIKFRSPNSAANPNPELNLINLAAALEELSSATDGMIESVEDALGNGGFVGSNSINLSYNDSSNALTLSVIADSSTIETATGGIRLKDSGTTAAKLSSTAKKMTQVLDIDSPTVSPDDADHLSQISVFGFSAPASGFVTLKSAAIYCDTSIDVGDSTNHYEFMIVNSAGNAMAAATVSAVGGLTAGSVLTLSLTQNNALSDGAQAFLKVLQYDDGTGGAKVTDLSSAKFRVVFTYENKDS